MPIAVYYALERDPDEAIALSLLLLTVSVVVLVAAAGPMAARRTGAVTTSDRRGSSVDAEVVRGGFTLELALRRRARRGARRARARTAPASRRCCARSPASCRRRAGVSGSAGRCWTTPATDSFVEAARRPVGFVFQDYRLFPHLTVLDNVAFSPRARGRQPAARPRRVAGAWLDRLGIAEPGRPPPGEPVGRAGAAGGAGPRAGRATRACCCSTSRWRRSDARTRMDVQGELRRHLADFAGPCLAGHARPAGGAGARRPAAGAGGRPGRPGGPAGRGRATTGHRLRGAAGGPEPLPRAGRRRRRSTSPVAGGSWCRTRPARLGARRGAAGGGRR